MPAEVIITIRIMPETVDVDFAALEAKINKEIVEFGGKTGKSDLVPLAFGLKALDVVFIYDEAKGATDALEDKFRAMPEVKSAEVTGARRALG